MFAKSRLPNRLSPKRTIAQKYPLRPKYHGQMHHTIDANRYYTRPSEDYNEDYAATRERVDYRQRNHTENKHNRHSAVTINLRSKTGHSYLKSQSYSNSKSENLSKGKYIFKPTEDLKEEKLLMVREERLSKLKEGYNLKNRMNAEKKVHSSVYNSNDRLNSLGDLRNKKLLVHSKQKKDVAEKKQETMEKQETAFIIPKFFNYCDSNKLKLQKIEKREKMCNDDCSFIENVLPTTLQKSNRVRSMKKMAETPPLIPANLQKSRESKINIDWIKGGYQPYLEIFENVSKDRFFIRKTERGVYFGQLRLNTEIFEGKGIIFYHSGKIFEGHFVEGSKQGLGYEYYPDKSSYLGNFSKGRRNGKGRFEWNNGEVYDGQWKNGKKEGSGIWKSQGDVSYVGEWHADTIEGFGVLIEKNTRYEGEFKNFMKWGNGTMRFENGQTYTGSFKQNLPNGIGDYYWNNSDFYHGEFVNGKRHGEGFIRYATGGSYKGQFKNDKKSGHGEQLYEGNLCYEGIFENDLKHGWGILYCDRNPLFQGYWLNNTAVDPTKRAIQTIVQQQSIYENDQSKNSRMKKIESSASMLRNKIMSKKLQRQKSLSKEKSLDVLPEVKPFRRDCNCERHRRINQQFS